MDQDRGEISLDYKIYRTKSAAQFTLIKPSNNRSESSSRIKPGSLLIEMANSKNDGTKAYDWANKITIALSVTELGNFCLAMKGNKTTKSQDDENFVSLAEFVHDPNITNENRRSEIKALTLSGKKGTEILYLNLRSRTRDNNKMVSIPLGKDDALVLYTLATRAISRALGW